MILRTSGLRIERQLKVRGRPISKPVRTIAYRVIGWIGAVVARIISPEHSYRVLWRILSLLFPIFFLAYRVANLRRKSRFRGEWRALILEHALTAMTFVRSGIKIPIEEEGMCIASRLHDRGVPVILCTGHFALTRAAFFLLESKRHPVLIADYNEKLYEQSWAAEKSIQILSTGVDVLARASTLVQSGHLLISFVDYRVDYSPDGITCISPSVFRLAAKTGATVLFFVPQLQKDGTIMVKFHLPEPSRPSCIAEADLCAAAFAEFATKHRGWNCVVRRAKSLNNFDTDTRP